jgi:uncharacterized protein (TIGR04255 family)
LGWFWKQYLTGEWRSAADAVPLPDQFEFFREQQRWSLPGLQLSLLPGPKPSRLQITNSDGDRMIQVQSTRFHYNWQKRNAVYPSYRTMRSEFDTLFAQFCRFAVEAGLGEVLPNQWEVTYVDQIPRGELWDSPADWHKVLPGILAAKWQVGIARLENVGGEWHYAIGPDKGRVHISLQHGRMTSPPETEVLLLQTTARGTVQQKTGWDLDSGLELGHHAAISAFLEITSAEAHRAWGLVED